MLDSLILRICFWQPLARGSAASLDPRNQQLFCLNGDGTWIVIHEDSPDRYSVIDNVLTVRGGRTMELGKKTHRIYPATAELGPQATEPHGSRSMAPGTFRLLVFGLRADR
jgi:hypothetical protein